MLSVIASIWKKEFLEILRDRRLLVFAVVFPCLVMPLLSLGSTYAAALFQKNLTGHKVTVVVDETVPSEAVAALAGESRLQIERRDTHRDAKSAPQCDNGCIAITARSIPNSSTQPLPRASESHHNAQSQVELTVRFDGSEPAQVVAQKTIHKTLTDLAKKTATQSRAHHGVAESVAEPLVINLADTGSKSDLFAKVLRFVLPLFIMLSLSAACVSPAIDFTAGEWERGTLERLLMTPAPRTAIMLGKILAASTIGYASGALAAMSFHALLSSGTVTLAGDAGTTAGAFPLSGLVNLLIHLGPAALILSAIATIFAVAARSYKAAQSTSSYIMLATLGLTALGLMSPENASWVQLTIPVANVAAVLRMGFASELSPLESATALLVNTLFAIVLAGISARIQPRAFNTSL